MLTVEEWQCVYIILLFLINLDAKSAAFFLALLRWDKASSILFLSDSTNFNAFLKQGSVGLKEINLFIESFVGLNEYAFTAEIATFSAPCILIDSIFLQI